MGAGAVGKTALTMRVVINQWCPESDPTIEDNYGCVIHVNGNNEYLDILDRAGCAQFKAITRHSIDGVDTIMLVYDVISFETFKHVQDLYTMILEVKEDMPFNIVLIGNKCDLYNSFSTIGANLKLTRLQIRDFLVYGYVRQAEDDSRDHSNPMTVPNGVIAVCAQYYGQVTYIEVPYEMGWELAKSWESKHFKVPFFQTSAKTGENVLEAFESVVMLAYDARSKSFPP